MPATQTKKYSRFYGQTPADLRPEERDRLLRYFELLGHVEQPIASLVVPVYRAHDTLLAHLVSLSHLKTIIPYEVLFIDNNANARTLNILRQCGARVVREPRQGITHARQKGLEMARGKVLLAMDPDTLYDPYYIDKMVLPFYRDTNVVLCYGISASYRADFRLPCSMRLRNQAKKWVFRLQLAAGFTHRIKHIRSVALAVRRSVLLETGYPTDLKAMSGCDDGMLAMMLYSRGRFKYVDAEVFTAKPDAKAPGQSFPYGNDRFFQAGKAGETGLQTRFANAAQNA